MKWQLSGCSLSHPWLNVSSSAHWGVVASISRRSKLFLPRARHFRHPRMTPESIHKHASVSCLTKSLHRNGSFSSGDVIATSLVGIYRYCFKVRNHTALLILPSECRIVLIRGSFIEDESRLGCNSVLIGIWVAAFERNLPPPSLRQSREDWIALLP